MKKIREVLRLRYERKATTRQIAESCKISVSTVSEYWYRADAAGYGWPLDESTDDAQLEIALFQPRLGQLVAGGTSTAVVQDDEIDCRNLKSLTYTWSRV